MLSSASGISLPAMGAGGEEKQAQGEGERDRTRCTLTQCHNKCSVCLLTKMSNAFVKLGNFPVRFRCLAAFCLMNEELAEGCFVRLFVFHFDDMLKNIHEIVILLISVITCIKAQYCSKLARENSPHGYAQPLCVLDDHTETKPAKGRQQAQDVILFHHCKK